MKKEVSKLLDELISATNAGNLIWDLVKEGNGQYTCATRQDFIAAIGHPISYSMRITKETIDEISQNYVYVLHIWGPGEPLRIEGNPKGQLGRLVSAIYARIAILKEHHQAIEDLIHKSIATPVENLSEILKTVFKEFAHSSPMIQQTLSEQAFTELNKIKTLLEEKSCRTESN